MRKEFAMMPGTQCLMMLVASGDDYFAKNLGSRMLRCDTSLQYT